MFIKVRKLHKRNITLPVSRSSPYDEDIAEGHYVSKLHEFQPTNKNIYRGCNLKLD